MLLLLHMAIFLHITMHFRNGKKEEIAFLSFQSKLTSLKRIFTAVFQISVQQKWNKMQENTAQVTKLHSLPRPATQEAISFPYSKPIKKSFRSLPFCGHLCSWFVWGTFLDIWYHSLDSVSLSHVSLKKEYLENLRLRNGLPPRIEPNLKLFDQILMKWWVRYFLF